MTDGDSRRTWKELLEELDGETDQAKLHEKVLVLEDVLLQCQQELANHPDRQAECDEIKKAIDRLYVVKVKKLGFPDSFNQLAK